MKKIILFLLVITINFNIKAQIPELWGIAPKGGAYNEGVLFKTDINGNNYNIQPLYNWFRYEGEYPTGNIIQTSTGKFYGLTSRGGEWGEGVLFEYDPATNTYIKRFDFFSSYGKKPQGSLLQAANGKLYGMTKEGGTNNIGVLFEYDPATNTYSKKLDFYGMNGSHPYGSLIQASNGKLYGMTYSGGNGSGFSGGVIFEYDTATNTYTKKYVFDSTNGEYPMGSLIQATNGKLYGMTKEGGANGIGVIFEYDPATNTYSKKYDFNGINGKFPFGSLTQTLNGKLYGMTSSGGVHHDGVLFEYDPVTNTYTKLLDFNGTNGEYPKGSLFLDSNGKLYGMTAKGGANDKGVLFEYDRITNVFTKKIDFGGYNGENPTNSLMKASDGKLYGMTEYGGTIDRGVLFAYDILTNTQIKKFDFEGNPDGYMPFGSLIQATNGKIYGMTNRGCAEGSGGIFEYDPLTDTYTVKIALNYPVLSSYVSLIQADNGKFYSVRAIGGAHGHGALFEYDLVTGNFVELYSFDQYSSLPQDIMQADNGKLYGITTFGGSHNYGSIYEYDLTTNTFTRKFSFDYNDGNKPNGALTQATNGKLYGMTSEGGAHNKGILYEYDLATDTYSLKLDFDGSNGANPWGALMNASNGKLYGLTMGGGLNSKGVLFEYDPTTDIYIKRFDFNGNDGAYPYASLMQASNGKLYGMTRRGGINDKGVIFEYDPVTNTFSKLLDFNGTNGAWPHSSLIEINASSSIESQTGKYINISPNPASNFLKISMLKKPVKVSVVNMAGILIYETNQTSKEMTIDMSNYAKAVYLVKIQTEKDIATYKVIKQ